MSAIIDMAGPRMKRALDKAVSRANTEGVSMTIFSSPTQGYLVAPTGKSYGVRETFPDSVPVLSVQAHRPRRSYRTTSGWWGGRLFEREREEQARQERWIEEYHAHRRRLDDDGMCYCDECFRA